MAAVSGKTGTSPPTIWMWKSTHVVQSELVDDRVLGAPMSSTNLATMAPLSVAVAAAWMASSRFGRFATLVAGRSDLAGRVEDDEAPGDGRIPPVASTSWAVRADTSPKPG